MADNDNGDTKGNYYPERTREEVETLDLLTERNNPKTVKLPEDKKPKSYSFNKFPETEAEEKDFLAKINQLGSDFVHLQNRFDVAITLADTLKADLENEREYTAQLEATLKEKEQETESYKQTIKKEVTKELKQELWSKSIDPQKIYEEVRALQSSVEKANQFYTNLQAILYSSDGERLFATKEEFDKFEEYLLGEFGSWISQITKFTEDIKEGIEQYVSIIGESIIPNAEGKPKEEVNSSA